MFDKAAIQALQEGEAITSAMCSVEIAMHASLNSTERCGITALPDHYKVHDLEKHMPTRRRLRGEMMASDMASFAAYVASNAEAGAVVLVNKDRMQAVAVLNLGTPDKPGHADNRAAFTADSTAAMIALLGMANGSGRKQSDVAEWMEDWAGHITCFNDAGEIPPGKAVAAIRKVTIDTLRRIESEEQQLSASTSAFQSVTASSKEPLPTTMYFRCDPYNGFAERLFVLRLSVSTANEKPAIGLRIVKREQHTEDVANELADQVRAAIDASTPVMLGTYSTSH